VGDCILTYHGPSGYAYVYGSGAGFITDTVGTYDFSLFLNGSHDLSNLAATFAGAANTLVTGNVTGFRVFTTGDFLQLTFDKGSDIPGNPVVQIFGMGFNLYRIT